MKEENDVQVANDLFATFQKLEGSISQSIIGQKDVVRLLITSIFCGGHSLLVGVPGLAKTLLVQTIAKNLGLQFNRIQFTPDLMPSDVLGAETLDQERNIRFIKGPIFSNVILADEINRTPPKTQSALLEAMQEHSVTIGGKHYKLDEPFFVLATQNPIEQEGTYPLPEAQLDRFMFMIKLDYPAFEEELQIVKMTTSTASVSTIQTIDRDEIIRFQNVIKKVPVADNVLEYAVNLTHKTRPQSARAAGTCREYLEWGAGPRASQNLILGAKCNALISGKYSPDIEDVKAVAIPVLRHRIVRNFKAEADGMTEDSIIKSIL